MFSTARYTLNEYERAEIEEKEECMREESYNKFNLCVLMTQFGKTFTSIGSISKDIKEDGINGRSISLVHTMNTLLNNKQFAERLHEIETEFGKGSVVICSSRKENDNYNHVKTELELQGIIANKKTCPRVIVMCSNKWRFNNTVEIINFINENQTIIKRIFVYYDELHQYINDSLRYQIELIDSINIVKRIVGLSATPLNIWKDGSGYWSKIRLFDLRDFNESDYIGYKDMIYNCIDNYTPNTNLPDNYNFSKFDKNTIDFITYSLDKYPEILNSKSKVFIPACKKRITHSYVRELIFRYNKKSIVITLNGIEKNLQYKDSIDNTKTIPLESKGEIGDSIFELIQKHKLENRPVVYTGYICVGMGQTLTSVKLGSFTHAVFGQCVFTNEEIYQLFGRITGRMKYWDKYSQTQVYCSSKIMNICKVMEECARNMAIENNGNIVVKQDYIKPMHEMTEGKTALENIKNHKEERKKIDDRIRESVPFTDIKDVNNFLKENNLGSFIKKFNKFGGYEISTRLNQFYKKNKSELKAEDRITKDKFLRISRSTCISSTGNGQIYMVYPVYKDLNSTPAEVEYYIRYLDRN